MFTKELFEPLNLKQLSYLRTLGSDLAGNASVVFQKKDSQELVTFSIFAGKDNHRFHFPADAIKKEEDRIELSAIFLWMIQAFQQHPAFRLRLVTGNWTLVKINDMGCIHPDRYPLISDPCFLDGKERDILHLYEKAKLAPRIEAKGPENSPLHSPLYMVTLGGQEGELMKQCLIKLGIVEDWCDRDTMLHKRLLFTDSEVQNSPGIKQAFIQELKNWGYPCHLKY